MREFYADVVTEIEHVAIRGDMIRLGQFLKFVGYAESGAHAGQLIAGGNVLVGGHVESRRGRQLHRGDIVALHTTDGLRQARVS